MNNRDDDGLSIFEVKKDRFNHEPIEEARKNGYSKNH